MEGVVTENDGEGAIALQVVMNAVVKYSCIDSVSLVSHGKAEIQNIADLKEDSSKEVPAEKDIDISAFPKTQPFVSSKKLNFYVSEEDSRLFQAKSLIFMYRRRILRRHSESLMKVTVLF